MGEHENHPFLTLQAVTKVFLAPGGEQVPILQNIDLGVTRGDSVAVVGPSGSGKTTLLNIIGSLDRPTSGTVILGGARLDTLDEEALAILRNREIGFIFQLHHLLPQCTVLENVLVPAMPQKMQNSEQIQKRAVTLLERVGLGRFMDYFPSRLSGGERQRVAVVRALINSPGIVLADEPTGSLDQKSADILGNLLTELNQEEGMTLITVTHSAALASKMKDQYRLKNGTLERS
jgi:lipoprotein-releasing system ATP-binding protein